MGRQLQGISLSRSAPPPLSPGVAQSPERFQSAPQWRSARPSQGLSVGMSTSRFPELSANSRLLLLPQLLLLPIQSQLWLSPSLMLPNLLQSTLWPSWWLEPTREPSMPMELASPSADVTTKQTTGSVIAQTKIKIVT